VLALVAAYALALQAILLVVAGPAAGIGDSLAAAICSHSGDNGTAPAPFGHGCDCLANCLAGCCGAAAPSPETAVIYAGGPAPAAEAALAAVATLRPRATLAHRSRAPPLAALA